MVKNVESMLSHNLWRGNELIEHQAIFPTGIDTGFNELNSKLSDDGWPASGVTEILYDRLGNGELSLLFPALRHFSQQDKWLIWIAPPLNLNAPALTRNSIDINKILLVHPRSAQDRLWCTEEALKSQTASAVLTWPTHLKSEHVRRLEVTAKQHSVPCFLFRNNGLMNSPCSLRLHVCNMDQNLAKVTVLKRKRGWSAKPVEVQVRNTPSPLYGRAKRATA